MPLVRFEVRNEYGLGDPELYRRPAAKEDPRALLDGVAVAGLVGILRQLGDLAEFAADIFHDLHQQVTVTAARGHKVMARVQHIEAALPLIEKAVQAQKSHIHFAYIAGCDWHANVQTEHDHLLRSDLPRFIMDSYEECHDPPRLFLLDKFDSAGAGACLKRYSDPSYFKRVWASSELVKAEKVQREKKTHKYKKKGSQQRNGEVQHVFSFSQPTGSVQFTSPGTDGQSIAAETLSTCDMRLKSEIELASRSTSFDSRTRFSYVEPVLGENSSMEPEQLEYIELSTSKIKIGDSGACVSVIPAEQNIEGADDDSQRNSLQERSAPRSPFVTWDEKTEIAKPTSPQLCEKPTSPQFPEKPLSPQVCDSILVDMVQDSESLRLISEQSNMEYETTKPGEDILLDIGKLPSFLGNNQFDEVASETDNYVDALNTLESETEMDSEFQTKREVKPLSNLSYQEIESGIVHIPEIDASGSDSTDGESPISSHTTLDKETSPSLSNSVSSGSVASSQSLHVTGLALHQGSADDNNFCESCDPDVSGTNGFEVVDGDLSSGSTGHNLQTILDNEITGNIHKPKESPPSEISDRPPIMFWTNGGLLGVEPSKPPVFSVSNIVHENSVSGTDIIEPDLSRCANVKPNESISANSCSVGSRDGSPNIFSSGHESSSYPDVPVGRANKLVRPIDPFEGSAVCHDDGSMNSQESVPAPSKTELDRFQDSHSVSIFGHTDRHDLRERNVVSSSKFPITSDIEVPSSVCDQDTGVLSSVSDLKCRLPASGFQRKASLTNGDTSIQSSTVNLDLGKLQERSLSDDERKRPSFVCWTSHEPNPKEKLEVGSSENSISFRSHYSEHPSPPLGHMKISFHPINGLETCKLKLEFPDSQLHESIEELMFPSFQLLPGPAVQLQDINSESDDDTFCRSCPYSSEDILSRCSESNSELWEQDEQSGSESHEMYDDSCRVSSSTASISSTLETQEMTHHSIHPTCKLENLEGENSIPCFQSALLLDIPSLDSLKCSMSQQEEKCDSRAGDPQDSMLQHPIEMPEPPPLPPLQWRKPSFASVENKRHNSSEVINHSDDLQSPSAGFRHPEQDTPKPPWIGEVTAHPNKITHDLQKLNGRKELYQSPNGKELDEREDLLNEIKNKSFSLRRTVTSRPSLMPGPTTNVNVAAILEKANAIRQAFVGSDDGGDDENWSDG